MHERAEAALITPLAGDRPARATGRATATLATAVLASALLAALAPTANAVTKVSYAPGGANAGLTIQASGDSQDIDRLSVSADANLMRVGRFAGSSGLVADSGCIQVDKDRIECIATGVRIVTANLASGNDLLSVNSSLASFVRGGPGDDVISGSAGADAIDGEGGDDNLSGTSGNDVLSGGDGNDTFSTILSGLGADVFNGGAGIDTASFGATSTAGVSVNLDNVANDGRPGDGQNVRSDVENLIGTAGNDLLVGSASNNRLEGLGGDDALHGGFGIDTLDGGLGVDVFRGGDGDDVLLARDGVDDQRDMPISCGGGKDNLVADLPDDDTRPVPAQFAGCEGVDQGATREGPNVVVGSASVSVGRDGVLSVRLSCPRPLRKRCSGTLATRLDNRGSSFGPPTRYSIRPGRSATVRTTLRAAQRAAARRRGARVALRSLERGLHGTKTTLRSLPAGRA